MVCTLSVGENMALGFFVGNRVTVARVCGGVVPNCITECRPVTNLLARL